jgi:hypothetical protein
MASRVVPATSEVITRVSPTAALTRDDLPTFGSPTNAIVNTSSSPLLSSPAQTRAMPGYFPVSYGDGFCAITSVPWCGKQGLTRTVMTIHHYSSSPVCSPGLSPFASAACGGRPSGQWGQ